MLTLSVSQRLELKGRAHALKPIVMIGNAGLTPAVLDEIERSLKSHDLLKVKVMHDEREVRAGMLQEICTLLKAGAVQHIGKTLVIYRPLEKPIAKAPKRPRGKPLTKKQLAGRR
ncbi:YhbY family RNA-binding protein [Ferrigenium sp. UT5]|uniref:YhbY family RNA-binding protein n=1 Tax=Ferrigenium sp. UT5 TaxID=3242105 RepID=UPI00354C4006